MIHTNAMSKKKEIPRPLPETLSLPHTGADSHAHLDSEGLFEHLPEIMAHAEQCGLSHIGQVFLGPAAYHSGKDAFAPFPNVFFIMGVHPCDALECTGAVLEDMRSAFQNDPRLKAVGETGLDFYWHDCPPPIQEEAFRLHIAMAQEFELPVVIHSRDAASDSLRILESEGHAGKPLLWHCFSGDAVPHLERILANGWHVSVGGPATYPANQTLRDSLSHIPLERLLLETDCPYLAPIPWRGKTNEPALVAFTADTIARCLNMPADELWTICGNNTLNFFKIADNKQDGNLPQTSL